MSTVTLDSAALGRFEGDVLTEGDAGYDDARKLFNAMIDRKPRVIIRAANAQDVIAAVGLARETGLPFAIKSGGHGVNGHAVCDDGIMLDLSPMKQIRVDASAKTVSAEAGVNWGEFDAATQEHGLATTGGRVTTTGIAGLTLGTGSGWLERLHGYTADNLISADVVTADGRLVHASEDENADLFWGLRGGGGNFGVVVNFEYRLHELPPLLTGGMLLWPADKAAEVLRFYREFAEGAPDEFSGACALLTAPPAPFVPAELQGQHAVGVIALALTDPERGEELLRPLRELAAAGSGHRRADAVPRDAAAARSGKPARALQLLEGRARRQDQRQADRALRGAPREDGTVALRDALPAARGADPRASRATRTRSRPAARSGRATASESGETPEESEAELAWVKAWGELIEPFKIAGAPLTFPGRHGRRVRAAVLRRGEVRTLGGPEGQVRPGQPLPAEPEHQAERRGLRLTLRVM